MKKLLSIAIIAILALALIPLSIFATDPDPETLPYLTNTQRIYYYHGATNEIKDGATDATPFASFSKAYAGDGGYAGLGGDGGTIVVCGGDGKNGYVTTWTAPVNSTPVLITSKVGGTVYDCYFRVEGTKVLTLSSDTIFDNIRIHQNKATQPTIVVPNGVTVVFGSGVTTTFEGTAVKTKITVEEGGRAIFASAAIKDGFEVVNSGTVVDDFSYSYVKFDISTKEDLINLATGVYPWNGNYTLTGNIDLENEALTTTIGTYASPFTGTFDGAGFEISGLNMTTDTISGLFGVIEGATVKNFTVRGAVTSTFVATYAESKDANAGGQVIGSGGACGLVLAGSTVENVTSHVTVTAPANSGGVIGIVRNKGEQPIIIKDCVNEGIANCTFGNEGGVIGRINTETTMAGSAVIIDGCINNTDITYGSNDRARFGGICGFLYSNGGKVEFVDCVNNGDLVCENTASGTNRPYVGGIVGRLEAKKAASCVTVTDCTNNGNITSSQYTGGIVGLFQVDSAAQPAGNGCFNCINTGDLSGSTAAGGIIAANNEADNTSDIYKCINTGATTGAIIGHFIGKDQATGTKWTITKNTIDLSALAWSATDSFTYDGTEKELTLVSVPAAVSAEYSGNKATYVGNYSATVVITPDDILNYDVTGTAPTAKAWTIVAANDPVAITAAGNADIGDEINLNSFISGAEGAVTVAVKSGSEGKGTFVAETCTYTPTHAGVVYFTVTVADTEKGGDEAPEIKGTTGEIAITVAPDNNRATFTNTATVKAGGNVNLNDFVNNADGAVTFTKLSGEGEVSAAGVYTASANAGTAVVRVDVAGVDNNADEILDIAATSAEITITVEAADNRATFNGSASVDASSSIQLTDYITNPDNGAVTYTITSGEGEVTAAGVYTASQNAGVAYVKIDVAGVDHNADETLDVKATSGMIEITINPVNDTAIINASAASVDINGNINLSDRVSNNVGTVTYTVKSGAGTVNAAGVYTAPNFKTTEVVTVTVENTDYTVDGTVDVIGKSEDITITVNAISDPAVITNSAAVNVGATVDLSTNVSAAMGTVTYTLTEGSVGSLNGSEYTAPNHVTTAALKATVKVTVAGTDNNSDTVPDVVGKTDEITITVNAISDPAVITPTADVDVGATVDLSANVSAAMGTVTYTLKPGSVGSLVGGVYTAPNHVTTAALFATVIVTVDDTDNNGDSTVDVNGKNGEITITVNAINDPAVITTTAAVVKGTTVDLSANVSGAIGTVTYALTSGGGSVNPTTGVYTAPASAGGAIVTVTVANKDNNGDSTDDVIGRSVDITIVISDKVLDTTTVTVSRPDYTYLDSSVGDYTLTGKPADTGAEDVLYTGILAKDGSSYTSAWAPTEAGSYVITAACESATTTYIATDSFTVEPYDITAMAIDVTAGTYSGTEQTVTINSISDAKATLTAADYTVVSGDKATNVEDTTLTVTGKGNFTGTATKVWKLTKATLTAADFVIPTVADTTYSGNPVSVAAPITAKTGVGAVTVKYSGATEAPVNAGTYAVTFDVAESNNYNEATDLVIGTFEIEPVEVDVTGLAWGTTTSFDFDETAKEVAIVGVPETLNANYTNNNKTYVGSYEATVVLTPKTANYVIIGAAPATISWSINAVSDPATVVTAANCYVTETVDLSANVTGAIGTVTYEVTSGEGTVSPAGVYTATANTGTAVVTVTVAPKDMNDDSTPDYSGKSSTITVTTIPKIQDNTTVTVSRPNYTYNDSLASVGSYTLTNKPAAAGAEDVLYTGIFAKDGSSYHSTSVPTQAGTYTIKVTCEDSTTVYTATTNFTVAPYNIAEMTIDVTAGTYSGTEQTVTITGISDANVTLTEADYTVVSGDKATNVEDTTLTVTGKGNFTGTATKVWKLTKATLTAADFTLPTVTDVTYSGNPVSVAAPTTAKIGVGAVTVKYNGATEAPVIAGTYDVTFDVAGNNNYNEATGLVIGTFKINRAPIDVSALTWNRENNEYVPYNEGEYITELTSIPDGTTVEYTNNRQTYAGYYDATATITPVDPVNYEIVGTVPTLSWRITAISDPAIVDTTEISVIRNGRTVNLSEKVVGAIGEVSYSVISGAGTVDPETGIYTSPVNTGTAVVRIFVADTNAGGGPEAEYIHIERDIPIKIVVDKKVVGTIAIIAAGGSSDKGTTGTKTETPKFVAVRSYANKFADVTPDKWFERYVTLAYEYGLANGTSETTFSPDAKFTVAQALTVAVNIQNRYYGSVVRAAAAGEAWYVPYVEYCIANNIIKADQFKDYDRNITRGDMAIIFANILPDIEYIYIREGVNADVTDDLACKDAFTKLYRAGIVSGDAGTGNFRPNDEILRSEACVIFTRIALPGERQN